MPQAGVEPTRPASQRLPKPFPIPFGYWAMSSWLESFAYRIDVGAVTLITAAALSLVIAVITVGYQAHRATRMDPAQSLRYE